MRDRDQGCDPLPSGSREATTPRADARADLQLDGALDHAFDRATASTTLPSSFRAAGPTPAGASEPIRSPRRPGARGEADDPRRNSTPPVLHGRRQRCDARGEARPQDPASASAEY